MEEKGGGTGGTEKKNQAEAEHEALVPQKSGMQKMLRRPIRKESGQGPLLAAKETSVDVAPDKQRIKELCRQGGQKKEG